MCAPRSPVRRSLLARRPVQGLDPALGLVEVIGRIRARRRGASAARSTGPAAVALGQLALGHELVGHGTGDARAGRTHALERMQFGRPDQLVPGRPPSAGREPRGRRGGRRPARRRLGGPLARHRRHGQGLGRPVGPHGRPGTASRCWPASGSPPSTRCTATSAGRSSSTSCSGPGSVLTPQLGAGDALEPARCPPPSRSDAAGAAGSGPGPLDYADDTF